MNAANGPAPRRMAGRVMVAAAVVAIGGVVAPPSAGADTINEMVENTFAEESPFWSYLYGNGYGYLDAKRVSNDGKIACINREAGVPPNQVSELLVARGYTRVEAGGIVTAEQAASESRAHPVC